jgi:hypothetical protein
VTEDGESERGYDVDEERGDFVKGMEDWVALGKLVGAAGVEWNETLTQGIAPSQDGRRQRPVAESVTRFKQHGAIGQDPKEQQAKEVDVVAEIEELKGLYQL